MQIKNWNDLAYLLAINRGRTYSQAAKLLAVDDTTVSRRLAALQVALDTKLFIRLSDGSLQMTDAAEAIIEHLDAIENSVGLIEETLATAKTQCVGTVRITSVPIVINRILAPNVQRLIEANPLLNVVLIPDSRDLSLSQREADLAVRLARPKVGGTLVKARKIGRFGYSVYAAKKLSARQIKSLSWVTYDDILAHIPPAAWTNKVLAESDSAETHLQVHDAETALQAVLAGSFKALLPDIVATTDKGLQRVFVDSEKPIPSRDVWLMGHADQSKMQRIGVAADWIEQTIAEFSGWPTVPTGLR